VQASAVKPLDSAYGSTGWRVSSLYGNQVDLAASGSYRSQYAVGSADVQSAGHQVMADARVDGSLVATKYGVFAGNPINDSFAVVNAGVPDVAVNYENRFVGKTGKNGTLLLTNLQSYYPGKVSIDPNTLPLNSNVTETEKRIAAKAMSGIAVDFGVKKDTSSALLILKDASGEFVPAGSLVTLEGQKDPFPMGYDGQVYLTGLAARNKVTTEVKGVTCSAAFDYKEDEARQVVIGPLTCG
jgi:outer membrane usher protein